jgi:MYXO-CTERM domain-containing protein
VAFVNQFVAAPNVPITVTTTDTDNLGYVQISAYTVEQVVSPASSAVPGPLPLVGAAAAFGWSRRLRGRIRAGQPRG